MRSRNFTPYLLLCLFVMLSQFSFAALPNKALINNEGINAIEVEANTTAVPTKALTKKQVRKQAKKAKKEARFEKRIAKFQKKMAAIDFNDPVKKWMWFAIFAGGAAIALSIIWRASITGGGLGTGIGILSTLSWVLWLAATVFLVIWLVKMFT